MLLKLYYLIKPFMSRATQIFLRRIMIKRKLKKVKGIWPIDYSSANKPDCFRGWPNQKQFAFVLTHDVDTLRGQDQCRELMKTEERLGFRSSFNFVPERYPVSEKLRQDLVAKGFEVGVHGLRHDGKLYKSREIFKERAITINRYLIEWGAVGFRSPAMHHNLDWIHDLNIEYDASTFDTDPFEPQPDGVGTVFPFWVQGDKGQKGYMELPYTLPQDFTLFILMGERNIDIWKQKLDWIVGLGGMVLLNTHPDYMKFSGENAGAEEYPSDYYSEFLEYIKAKYEGQYWHVLPKDIARFCSGDSHELKGDGRGKF